MPLKGFSSEMANGTGVGRAALTHELFHLLQDHTEVGSFVGLTLKCVIKRSVKCINKRDRVKGLLL